MVNTDDPHNYRRQVDKHLRSIKKSDEIDEPTTDAIVGFAEAQLDGAVPEDDDLALGSVATYTDRLRRIAREASVSLTTTTPEELNDDYLEAVRYQKSASYYNTSTAALTALSGFHGWGWEGEFGYEKQPKSTVDEEKFYSDEEVNAFLENGDARDQAMVGLLADTGSRAGALASFRIRDLDRDGDVPQLRFNTEAPTKGAEGKILLSWSIGHLDTYLATDHPRPDDPEAPIIHKQRWSGRDDGALSPRSILGRIKDLGEEAGVSRDRMRTHNFRHTAVSNWIRQGYTPQEIVHLASWASSDMLDIYDNVTDEQRNKDIAVKRGQIDDEDVVTDPSEATMMCPRCKEQVRRNANFCGKCSLEMSRAPSFEDDVDPVTAEPDASADHQPGKVDPDELWSDGAGEVLDEVPTDTLLRKLLEREDVDASDLLDE